MFCCQMGTVQQRGACTSGPTPFWKEFIHSSTYADSLCPPSPSFLEQTQRSTVVEDPATKSELEARKAAAVAEIDVCKKENEKLEKVQSFSATFSVLGLKVWDEGWGTRRRRSQIMRRPQSRPQVCERDVRRGCFFSSVGQDR